ncbi:MAG: GNAT family N-acetyltransferase [Alphaproteobacteria bacterium]
MIGDLRFERVERMRNTLELGYSITSLYRRQGYATEAAGRLLDWAFNEGGVRQVIAGCNRKNRPSVRTLRRLGFWLDGARGDDFWWAITPDLRAEARETSGGLPGAPGHAALGAAARVRTPCEYRYVGWGWRYGADDPAGSAAIA